MARPSAQKETDAGVYLILNSFAEEKAQPCRPKAWYCRLVDMLILSPDGVFA